MNLCIVIPTLDRIKKLEECIESIIVSRKDLDVKVKIYFNVENEKQHFEENYKKDWISYYLIENYNVPTFWNGKFKELEEDALLYLNDDVTLLENTLELLMKTYEERFPNYDGVLGIKQENIPIDKQVKTAFACVGKEYARRFPDSQVFCPDYNRFFADYEIYLYSKSIDKFYFDENIKLIHHHPAYSNSPTDYTHRKVRRWLSLDKKIYHNRFSNGLLWGRTFELIKGEKNEV